jgi:DNA-binding response OmpR family regulator
MAGTLSKKSILYVDGFSSGEEQLSELLEQYGYEMTDVSSSEDGVKALASRDNIDLVIIDLTAPDVHGLDLIGEIRAMEKCADIPILVLTVPKGVDIIDEVLDAGCDDYLLKPVDPRLLYHRVQSLIESFPRAYRRVSCSVLIEISTGKLQTSGEMTEIGEGGLGVILEEQLKINDLVKTVFMLPGDDAQLVAGAEVIYIKEADEGFLHGMKFEIIDSDTRSKIISYVSSSGD